MSVKTKLEANNAKLTTISTKLKETNKKLLCTRTITANGTYTPNAGYFGFSSVTVNVAGGNAKTSEIRLQEKTV